MPKKTTIQFCRTREVKLPNRSNKHDAGIDFFVPSFDKEFIEDLKLKNSLIFEEGHSNNPTLSGTLVLTTCGTTGYSSSAAQPKVNFDVEDENDTLIKFDEEEGKNYFAVAPLSRALIPSGIYCKMEAPDRALIAANKSGIASKKGLIFGAQVVDYEYQGEIHISVINASSKTVRIYEDQKLIQFLEMPIFTSVIKEVKDTTDLYDKITDRGVQGFGDHDKK